MLLIIVLQLIVIKYYKNYKNEEQIYEALASIENKIQNNNFEDMKYKNYKIEGILEIPSINIKYPIIYKTSEETLKISVTKFCGSQEKGNYILAGHNNKDGTMFGKIKYLNITDKIKIINLENKITEYEVFKIYLVKPDDTSCIESIQEELRELTLITCTNGHKNRLIIKAKEIL